MTPPDPATASERLAQRFHETYERLAPSFGYETREASAKPWAEVPENNRKLMTAVCAEIVNDTRATPALHDEVEAILEGIIRCIDSGETGAAWHYADTLLNRLKDRSNDR